MDETVDQIEQRIERSRQGLRSNLNELGDRMKSAIDWRETFRRNPAATFAVAFIGGVLLASAVGRAEASQRQRRVSRHIAFNRVRSGSQQRALRAWDEIKSALVGMVAAKVTSTLAEALPGFKEQLNPRLDDSERVVGGTSAKK